MTGHGFRAAAFAALIAALGFDPATAAPAAKDAYPNKPVRMVIPFAAGGFSDVVGRIVTQKLSENLGQPVVADNRPGASGIIGSEIVVRAAPDGYTLLLNSFNHVVNPSLMRLPYDPIKGFTVISMIAGGPPLVMMVNPSSPMKSVKDLIALAKQRPGQLNYGSSGIGTSGHLIGELFKLRSGADIVHVAYKSSGASMTAIIGGEVNMASTYMPVALPQVQSGRLRALAVTSARRSPVLPDVPTMAEAGVKGIEVIGFAGLLGPPNMPAPLVKRLHEEMIRLAKDADFAKRYAAYDMDPVATTGAEFARYMQREIDLWAEVIRSAGIKPR
ncbi:MAG: Bug family tripartite tricarboxylate transporter substrate binding protein [Betaproteobacteria bacterium]